MSLVQQVCIVARQVEVVAAQVDVLGDSRGGCDTVHQANRTNPAGVGSGGQ